MNFIEISNNILKEAKGYGDIHPEFLNIFEITFSTYIEIVRSLNKTVQKSPMEIKEQVVRDIFGSFEINRDMCDAQDMSFESNDFDNDLLSKLKNNLNNINKEKLEENSKKTLENFKDK